MADDLINDREFILAAARCGEGLLTEADLRKRYCHLDESAWDRLANDEELIATIQDEKIRRIKSGATARERAQVLYAEVPNRLGDFLRDPSVSPRHAIESAKEIRAIANPGPEATPAAEAARFLIQINFSDGEVLTYPNDGGSWRNSKNAGSIERDSNADTATPEELVPIANKRKDDDNGGNFL